MGLSRCNIVMKLTCNGQPVAKLSDSPGKTLCDDETFLAYLRQVFRQACVRTERNAQARHLAQLNPTIGDIDGNIALMCEAAREAAHAQASRLVIFPSCRCTAYYPADLLDEADLCERMQHGFADLLRGIARSCRTCIGWSARPRGTQGVGKRLHNSLLVLKAGRGRCSTYHKQLLPTYNIFDERRHFEPGPDVARVLRIGDVQVGFMICEDGWNDDGPRLRRQPLRAPGATPRPTWSCPSTPAPRNMGKREQRHEIFGRRARATACPSST